MSTNYYIRFIDSIALAWYLYGIYLAADNNLLLSEKPIYSTLYIAAYLFGRVISKNSNALNKSITVITGCLLTFTVKDHFFNDLFLTSNKNPNLIAIQYCMCAAYCIWYFVNGGRTFYRVLCGVLAASILILIIYLESRTAIAGFALTALYSTWQRYKKVRLPLLLPVIAAFILLAFYVKPDSTSGRWFITKLSLQVWKDNFLQGTGIGLYNPAYNHKQIEYFSQQSLYSKEAWLADNGHYALNEWLQIAIEQGIVGLLLSLLITVFLLRCYLIKNADEVRNSILAFILPLLVGCMFSYPLHVPILTIIICFCTGNLSVITNTRFSRPIFKLNTGRSTRYSFIAFVAATAIGVSWLSYLQINANNKWKRSAELYSIGYKNEAAGLMSEAEPFLKSSYGFGYGQANSLYKMVRAEEALSVLKRTHLFECSQKIHALFGDIYLNKNDSINAVSHYYQSLLLIPNKLGGRYKLLVFYDRYKDTSRAIYWANEIIRYPVKINAAEADAIKARARLYKEKVAGSH